MEWLVESRRVFLKKLLRGEPLTYFSAHLPVVATWSGEGEFPVNLTAKGIGLIPRGDLLGKFTDLFERVLKEVRGRPWSETLEVRAEALFKLYDSVENFDPTVLGGLEIFGGRTLENLRKNPRAVILYAGLKEGERVSYISFQVNAKVEIVDGRDPRYRFLLLARKLFEFDRFHLYQPDYPFGYIFKVEEVRDKSPWSRSGSRGC
jgi:hypothetical protein